MSNISIQEVEQQFHLMSQAGKYAEALDLVTREAHRFPNYSQGVVYYWRMSMACRLNNPTLALQLLEEAIRVGYWYHGLREDADLQLLWRLSEFEELVQICEERRALAIADATPVLKTLQPEHGSAPYPLLLTLHGNQSNVESFAHHWSTAASHGWLVGLPQSSQSYGQDTFSWNDWEWSIQEVQKDYDILRAQNLIDSMRVVLAGFSMGGGLATWLALSGAIHVSGLILVAPFFENVENLVPLMQRHSPQKLRAWIVASQRDKYCYGIAEQLSKLLPQYGILCQSETYSDLEHSFPTPFETRLPQVLDWLVER